MDYASAVNAFFSDAPNLLKGFIAPNMGGIPFALIIIGQAIKSFPRLPRDAIPFILLVCGALIGIGYTEAVNGLSTVTYTYNGIVAGAVQGVIAYGMSQAYYQMYKKGRSILGVKEADGGDI